MEASQSVELVDVLAGHTRISVPHKAHADAMEELDALRTELRSAFERLAKAQDQLEELGIKISVDLDTPLSQAWKEWQANHALESDLAR